MRRIEFTLYEGKKTRTSVVYSHVAAIAEYDENCTRIYISSGNYIDVAGNYDGVLQKIDKA